MDELNIDIPSEWRNNLTVTERPIGTSKPGFKPRD
jgi:hypothetical protein